MYICYQLKCVQQTQNLYCFLSFNFIYKIAIVCKLFILHKRFCLDTNYYWKSKNKLRSTTRIAAVHYTIGRPLIGPLYASQIFTFFEFILPDLSFKVFDFGYREALSAIQSYESRFRITFFFK